MHSLRVCTVRHTIYLLVVKLSRIVLCQYLTINALYLLYNVQKHTHRQAVLIEIYCIKHHGINDVSFFVYIYNHCFTNFFQCLVKQTSQLNITVYKALAIINEFS